jgi:serine/threonine protein kinase/WD40 repeat protein
MICQGHSDADLRRYTKLRMTAQEAEALERHLDGCATCRQRLTAIYEEEPSAAWLGEGLVRRAHGGSLMERPEKTVGGSAKSATEPSDSDALQNGFATDLSQALPERVGNYTVVRKIAAGGMGTILEAFDPMACRRVALKLIHGPMNRRSSVQRMMTEAHALARLSHPGIVHVYGVELERGRPVLVLEYVDGQSLDVWQNKRLVDSRLAAELVRNVAAAVSHAHARGVIHRDLKPANVMLVGSPPFATLSEHDRWEVKVTDFGISRMADRLSTTLAGEIMGTPAYMAPEQTTGAATEYGTTVDVYGLGAILYELLTGRAPFSSTDPVVTLELVRNVDPVPPKVLRPDLSEDLNVICLKCLEKNPERRFATAAELADELTAFLEHRPIKTRPLGNLERTVRWARRNQKLATAMAVILSLLVISTVGALGVAYYFRQTELYFRHLEREQRALAESNEALAQEKDRANRQSQRTLADMYTTYGIQASKDGRDREAILWFANAAQVIEGLLLKEASPGNDESSLAASQRDDAGSQQADAEASDDREQLRQHVNRVRISSQRLAHPSAVFLNQDRIERLTIHPSGQYVLVQALLGAADKIFDVTNQKQMILPNGIRPDSLTWTPDGKMLVAGMAGKVQLYTFPELLLSEEIPCEFLWPTVPISVFGTTRNLGNPDETLPTTWQPTTENRPIFTRTRLVEPSAESLQHEHPRPGDSCRTGRADWVRFGSDRHPHRVSWNDAYRLEISLDRSHEVVTTPEQPGTLVKQQGAVEQANPSETPTQPLPRVVCLDFDKTGRFLAIAGEHVVRVWDREQKAFAGPPLLHSHTVEYVLFSPDGWLLVTGTADSRFRVFSITNNIKQPLWEGKHIAFNECTFNPPCFTADGRFFVTLTNAIQLVIWDVKARQIDQSIESPVGFTFGIKTAATKNEVLLSGTRGLITFDVSQFATQKSLTEVVTVSAAYGPHDDVVVGCRGTGEFVMWSLPDQRVLASPAVHPQGCSMIAFSADGQYLATAADDNHVRLWKLPQPAPGKHFTDLSKTAKHRCTFSPDSQLIALTATSKEMLVYDVKTGKEVVRLIGSDDTGFIQAHFLPDGERLATCSTIQGGGGRLEIWNWRSGERLNQIALPTWPQLVHPALHTNASGTRLVAVCERSDVLVLDMTVPEGRLLRKWDGQTALWYGLSPDGLRLLGSVNEQGWVLNIETGQRQLTTRHGAMIWSGAYSHDGRLLATSADDRTVQIWDIAEARQVGDPLHHPAAVFKLEFSADSQFLMTASRDSSVRVWDVSTQQPVTAPITAFEDLTACFRAKGRQLVVADYEGHLDVWDWRRRQRLMPSQQIFHTRAFFWDESRMLKLSPDGRRVALGGVGGIQLVPLTDLDATSLPRARDLVAAAEVLSHMRIQDGSTSNLTFDEWYQRWDQVRTPTRESSSPFVFE